MTWRVRFKEVGRARRNWSAEFDRRPGYSELYREIRSTKALGSRGIDFVWGEDGLSGSIYVGDIRKVGTFTIEEVVPA